MTSGWRLTGFVITGSAWLVAGWPDPWGNDGECDVSSKLLTVTVNGLLLCEARYCITRSTSSSFSRQAIVEISRAARYRRRSFTYKEDTNIKNIRWWTNIYEFEVCQKDSEFVLMSQHTLNPYHAEHNNIWLGRVPSYPTKQFCKIPT